MNKWDRMIRRKHRPVGSVYFPIDAHLTPARFCPALTVLLKEMGVRFQWGTTITGWRTDGRRLVAAQTAAGDLAADEFVLAGGSWSAEMLAGLKARLPLQAGKGYSLTVPKPRFRVTKPYDAWPSDSPPPGADDSTTRLPTST